MHVLLLIISITLLNCNLTDDERCPDGFKYAPDTMTCIKLPDAAADASDAQ